MFTCITKTSESTLLASQELKAQFINDPSLTPEFICPECRSDLVLKAGLLKTPHFAHKTLSECFHSGTTESPEHLEAKERLLFWINKYWGNFYVAEKEKTIFQNGKFIRPDIVLNTRIISSPRAIELQRSDMTFKQFVQRCRMYGEFKVPVMWVLFEDKIREDSVVINLNRWQRWLWYAGYQKLFVYRKIENNHELTLDLFYIKPFYNGKFQLMDYNNINDANKLRRRWMEGVEFDHVEYPAFNLVVYKDHQKF